MSKMNIHFNTEQKKVDSVISEIDKKLVDEWEDSIKRINAMIYNDYKAAFKEVLMKYDHDLSYVDMMTAKHKAFEGVLSRVINIEQYVAATTKNDSGARDH